MGLVHWLKDNLRNRDESSSQIPAFRKRKKQKPRGKWGFVT